MELVHSNGPVETISAKDLNVEDAVDGRKLINLFAVEGQDHYSEWKESLDAGPIVVKDVVELNNNLMSVHFDISFEPVLLEGNAKVDKVS